ncbi:MAG: preprotein translocase subunit YajC [Phycisphaerales bacterium]|nr:preprotein translocase subunit YajC [Phycisphaerales bacterium]
MNTPILTMWSAPVLAQADRVIGDPVAGGGDTAVVGADGAQGGGGTGGNGSPFGGSFFIIIMVMMVGMILMTSLSGRKEKKRRAALLSAIGKRDKVQTSSGIIGTIIEIKGDELLIETDRASNSRLRIARGSIQQVLRSESKPEVEEDDYAVNGVDEN